MDMFDHILLGIQSVFLSDNSTSILGISFPTAIVMVVIGLIVGTLVGATPGLAGPMAMAVALPILISIFGYDRSALLPVLGFLIGIMKGSTIGGAVPAILFNTPGTPDAVMTTLDGTPMTRAGQPYKALRTAHFSSVMGDSFSDIILFICAPFLALFVEYYLDLPEKAALIILSLAFISVLVGNRPDKGFLSLGLGLFIAYIGSGEDFYPRLTGDIPALADGFPLAVVILGVLIVGEVFTSLDDIGHEIRHSGEIKQIKQIGSDHLTLTERLRMLPYIGKSALIGTVIGALPGIGSTMAATLGYAAGRKRHAKVHPDRVQFGKGAPEGIAATESANSAVSGANLIPVLSLGIPGNVAAVFLLLAMDSIDGLNPGPAVFKIPNTGINSEMVMAFGLFTLMALANAINWVIGGRLMRMMGVMIRVPKQILLPTVLVLTLLGVYAQESSMSALIMLVGFGVLGYIMRRLDITVLPFVIAFILGRSLESTVRQAFAATGSDPWFLFSSSISAFIISAAVIVILYPILTRLKKKIQND